MRRPRRAHLVVLAVALTFSACTKGEIAKLPPAPELPATTTTAVIDLSGIALNDVPGRTTSTLALQPGSAAISGAVVGPGGPVVGAIVRAERIVGDASGSVDIQTGPDGTFAFTGMLGGRYRVRAWKPTPDNLALIDPEVFFLEAKESKVFTLTVRPYQGLTVTSDIAPDPPEIGAPANLLVQVVDRGVDAQGVVRSTPVVDARVELFGAGDWKLRSANPVTSDGNGRALFTVECQRAGEQPLSVVVGDTATFPLDLPPCAVPIEEDGSDGSDGSEESATTSSRPAATTTTRPATTTSRRTTTTAR